MKPQEITTLSSVMLFYDFKQALYAEEYLTCKEIKEELIFRIQTGDLDLELIEATQIAANIFPEKYGIKDLETEVLNGLFEECKTMAYLPA